MPNLTDLSVQKLPEGIHLDAKTRGFGIRVGKTRKTWIVLHPQTRSKESLGQYPAMSLSEARRRAQERLLQPSCTKPAPPTFPEALEAFLSLPRWRPKSLSVLRYSLNHFTWKRPLDKITPEDVHQALGNISGKSARAHALKDIKAFFNWCVPRYLTHSPCQGIKMEPQASRDRVLTDAELKALWNSCEGIFGRFIQLLILTGQRRNEIASLTRDMVEEDRITFPAWLTKNGREHTIPITPYIYNLLPPFDGLLFPGNSRNGTIKPMTGFATRKAKLDKAADIAPWTLHDLRRTFATNMARLQTPIHITEKILNHVSGTTGGIIAVYQRYSYFDEQREALEKHQAFVLKMVG